MSKSTILHVFNNEIKFSKSFFSFLQSNKFDLSRHTLFQYSKKDQDYEKFNIPIVFTSLYSLNKNLKLLTLLFKNDKLILHNLASPWLLLYLYLFPSLTKKVYWVIWGKDLYFYKLLDKKHIHHKIYEYFRKRVFKNIKHVISNFEGDYKLATEWYGTKAEFHECFMYPSNLFKFAKKYNVADKKTNILIGNSADPSNNHLEVFKKLQNININKVAIYVPLSYGNKGYATEIIAIGKEMFGDCFNPITNFIPFDEYINFLYGINIAIFAHNRQQAVGNLVSLLGFGKKVYLNKNTTHYRYFKSHGIALYDLELFNINNISTSDAKKNQSTIKQLFSTENLISGIRGIFND
jgi:hypothetical protein